MLQSLHVGKSDHIPATSMVFSPEFNVVSGHVRQGKTMLLRDVLFLLLSGKIPGKRTLSSLGGAFSADCTLVKGAETLSITRSGSKVSILEDRSCSGATAVREKVAAFTGIQSTALSDLCYCSGVTLPGDICSDGALLKLMRSVIGDGPSMLLREVNRELGALRIPEIPATYTQSQETLDREIDAIQAQLTRGQENLQAWAKALNISRSVMDTPLRTDVERRMADIDGRLKGAGVLGDKLRTYREASVVSNYAMSIMEQYTALGGDAEYAAATLPDLVSKGGLAKEVQSILSGAGISPTDATALLQERKVLEGQAVTDEQARKDAGAWLQLERDTQQSISMLQAQLSEKAAYKRLAQESAQASADVMQMRRDIIHLQSRLDLLRSCLLPSGEFSVERELTELYLRDVLSTASGLLCTAGIPLGVTFTAENGMRVNHAAGELGMSELSGSETLMTALCLRLAVSIHLKKSPFLVMDDITGPVGHMVQDLCSMLAYCSHRYRMQLILISADPRVCAENVMLMGD